MRPYPNIFCTAFNGSRRIASGQLAAVAEEAKATLDGNQLATVLIFDDTTSELVEVDFRGTVDDVLARIAELGDRDVVGSTAPQAPRGPGRPKLGVVAHEITLLPRHWDWLNSQPGGASVTLRKLVDEARRSSGERDRIRLARESTYQFMLSMAGDFPGFEEATRALFAGDPHGFDELIATWPSDICDHARKLASAAFSDQSAVA